METAQESLKRIPLEAARVYLDSVCYKPFSKKI
jgi:hypothetical protein